MNKIIDTQCECCNTDTILKIVAGNDFTLRLALTYHEDDVVKEYDLSDIQDLKVIAYSPEGVDREVDSMVDIATNRIIAVIDSYEYINYVPYGIDITWYDEPNHKRASAPNLFAFVNSSGEANDSQDVIVSGPYDYNLEIKSDIAYVSVGEIPEIDLTQYVTNSELNTTLEDYATKEYVDDELEPYINEDELGIVLENYVSNSSLSMTLEDYATKQYVDDELANIDLTDYYTKSEVDTTLQDYVTSSSLNTTLADYALETDMTAAQGNITSLDARVTTLENNPSVPSNVVTSDDGNEIICLTQAEYDALEQAQTLDPDAFYYITDTTSNYVTNSALNNTLSDYALASDLNSAESDISSLDNRVTTLEQGGGGGGTPDNMVTTDTQQTIYGEKMFTAESKFGMSSIDNNDTWMNTDLALGVYKSSMFVRPTALQMITGDIVAPNENAMSQDENDGNLFNTEAGVIKFRKIDSNSGGGLIYSMSELARIDSNGIYEGTTLLSDKYALKSEIPTSSGVSEEDWDNSNEAIAKELTNNRLAHLSINDKFNDYYTKSEADSRYATQSWANNKFVTKTDDVNRQEAIAATFAYLQTAIDKSGGGGSEVDLSSYVTMDEMNNYSEVVSTALTNNKLDIININDKFNDYYTKSQADSRYVTSNDVAQKYVSNSSLDNLSHVVASSLNDLNDRMPSNTSDLTNDSGFVTSSTVTTIWQGSQTDYDAIATKDTNTLYIIL